MQTNMTNAPGLDEAMQFATERPRTVEVVGQSLYDLQEYPAAGRSEFEFFSTPVGQGVSAFAAGRAKTFADTNMEAPKMLPQGVSHLLTAIYVTAFRSLAQSEYGFVAGTGPAPSTTQDTVPAILENGALSLIIGSKSFLSEAKLTRFPMPQRIKQDGDLATNSATAGSIVALYEASLGAVNNGESAAPLVYVIDPPILIPPQQNFAVKLSFLPPIATVSTGVHILGVFMDGYRYRYAQ